MSCRSCSENKVYFPEIRYHLLISLLLSAPLITRGEKDSYSEFIHVTDTNIAPSVREVKYYLQQQENTSCDQVCESRGLLCTAKDHGFENEEKVLSIFEKLLGKECLTGFNDTDQWNDTRPSYLNSNLLNHKLNGRCLGWKAIPQQIKCETVPQNSSIRRLCPCVNDVTYHLSKTAYSSCDQVCGSRRLSCTAENHGFSDNNILRIFDSLLGWSCPIGHKDTFITATKVKRVKNIWFCTQWKAIPPQIYCGFTPQQNVSLVLCPCVFECNLPLGMKNFDIPDWALTASSEYAFNTRAAFGRLGLVYSKTVGGAWSANVLDIDPWIQVFLGSSHEISKIATQGRNKYKQWVTSYTLSYSDNGNAAFVDYRSKDNEIRVFPGNTDSDTVVLNLLSPYITTRYIRVEPRTFENWISMRIELFGCQVQGGFNISKVPRLSISTKVLQQSKLTESVLQPSKSTEILQPSKSTEILQPSKSTEILQPSKPTEILQPLKSTEFLQPSLNRQTNFQELPPFTTSVKKILKSTMISEVTRIRPSPVTVVQTQYTASSISPSEKTVKKLKSEKNNVSATTLLVKWERPISPVLGYHVSYKSIKVASVPVSNAPVYEFVLNGNCTTIMISGLESFTTYNVTVTPIGRSGSRIKSNYILTDTCRCPKHLKADWWINPPYTLPINQPGKFGIVTDIVKAMVKEVCRICPSYGQTDIDFQSAATSVHHESRTKRSTTKLAAADKVDLVYPMARFPFQKTFLGYSYIPVVEVPGFALITVIINKQGVYTQAAASTLYDFWPYFLIYIAMTVASGIILWIFESHGNQDQFPRSFIKGVLEGVWWSFTTITTVGYGDRYPKTFLARIFAIAWFFVGMIINSMMISFLTSSITVMVINEVLDTKPGKNVGVLQNSPGEFYASVLKKVSGKVVTYGNLTALSEGLLARKVDSVILDMNVAGYRNDLFNDSWSSVSKVINYPFTVGAAVSHNTAKLEKFFRAYLKENQIKVLRFAQDVSKKNETQKEIKFLPIDSEVAKTDLLWASITWTGVSLAVAFVLGITFHCFMRWRERSAQRRHSDESARKRSAVQPSFHTYINTKREMQLVVMDFHDNITRIYKKLTERHLKERKKLLRLIKEKNKRRQPGKENYEDDPTPRARPVSFVNNDLDANYLNKEMFELGEIFKIS